MSGSAFIQQLEDADEHDVDRLGGKGAGLAGMIAQGLPVPTGFVITTEACRHYLQHDELPAGFDDELGNHLARLETRTGKRFGSGPDPLLLSVRSGAPVSMPGMMDTILDMGLNRAAATALAGASHDTRFMADLVRRFYTMYADTVLGALDAPEGVLGLLDEIGVDDPPGETFDRVWTFCRDALADDLADDLAEPVPTDPHEQLRGAILAVFGSWNTRRARTYREHHKIPDELGTAVVVQMMVFGNLGQDSGSGVVFTRDPSTGEQELYGEFLASSQGEDVVSGEFTPVSISQAERSLPEPFAELRRHCSELEARRGDVLDIEFTIERSQLYLLQVRSAKRTAEAAVRIAHDMTEAGALDAATAIGKVSIAHIRQIQRPGFDGDEVEAARSDDRLITIGVGACPGQVSGSLCFDSDAAKQAAAEGTAVILARPNTSPADLHGMIAAEGIVTATGGSTSHAAVVARALGTPCVVGCSDIDIDPGAGTFRSGDTVLSAGDQVSVDGSTGELFAGVITSAHGATATAAFTAILDRCREASGARVLARVTLPSHVEAARLVTPNGVVTAIDDVLAASGQFEALAAALGAGAGVHDADFAAVEQMIAAEFVALLDAVGDSDMSVRALDFLADDTHELFERSLLGSRPKLALPLGVPELVEAQLAGLAQAAQESGRAAPLGFALRHLCDVREGAGLKAANERVQQRYPDSPVFPGVYATNARGVRRAAEINTHVPILWADLKVLIATDSGKPSWLLPTQQPLDDYLRDGHLAADPRTHLDDDLRQLLESLASHSATPPGVRLSVPVTDELVDELYSIGFRLFAADAAEVQPLTLALGKAALSHSQ